MCEFTVLTQCNGRAQAVTHDEIPVMGVFVELCGNAATVTPTRPINPTTLIRTDAFCVQPTYFT